MSYLLQTRINVVLICGTFLATALLLEQGKAPNPTISKKPVYVLTETDRAIFDCVLTKLSKQLKWNNPYLLNQTGIKATADLCDQDVSRPRVSLREHSVPHKLYLEACKKVETVASLADYQPKIALPHLSVADAEKYHNKRVDEFNHLKPSTPDATSSSDWRTIITLALPGYNDSKKEALMLVDIDDGGGYFGQWVFALVSGKIW